MFGFFVYPPSLEDYPCYGNQQFTLTKYCWRKLVIGKIWFLLIAYEGHLCTVLMKKVGVQYVVDGYGGNERREGPPKVLERRFAPIKTVRMKYNRE